MKFLKKNRKYISSKGVHDSFLSTLPKDLTLINPLPKKCCEVYDTGRLTPFHEVLKAPYATAITMHERKLMDELELIRINAHGEFRGEKKVNYTWKEALLGNWKDIIFDAIVKGIESKWDPDKFHVIGSSSGYDTRVMFAAIRYLIKKNGADWAGDYFFIEAHGESEEFLQIMTKYKEENYLIYRPYDDAVDFHKDHFDIKTHYKIGNGIVAYPYNHWYHPYVALQKDGIIPKDNLQFVTGYGSNEIEKWAYGKSMSFFLQWHYFLQLNTINYITENVIMPFWSHDFIKMLFFYGSEIYKQTNRAIRTIADYKLSEVKNVPRLAAEGSWKDPIVMLKPEIANKIKDQYLSTWYGKNIGLTEGYDKVEYNRFWANYYMASLCEFLRNTDRNITIDG